VAQFISAGAQTIYTRFFAAPSPDAGEIGGSPGSNQFKPPNPGRG
jgi:hypothetical protein